MAIPKNFKLKKRSDFSFQSILEGIENGDTFSLSKAITLVESQKTEHQELATKLVNACNKKQNKSLRIGITGVPGAGKSTFIESFGQEILKQNKKLAVLAVDPSSSLSNGSILGDKTRMDVLSRSEGVFIRPSPAGKNLGGVAKATRESMILCEAAGFDYILIETVGVGQSETEVHSMVDLFVLLTIAGAGDELQGIKRGIMEMADLIVINKADEDNDPKIKETKNQIKNAIHYFYPTPNNWTVQVLTASALKNKGIPEVLNACTNFYEHQQNGGWLNKKRNEQNLLWFRQHLNHLLELKFLSGKEIQSQITHQEQAILKGNSNPFEAAQKIMKEIFT